MSRTTRSKLLVGTKGQDAPLLCFCSSGRSERGALHNETMNVAVRAAIRLLLGFQLVKGCGAVHRLVASQHLDKVGLHLQIDGVNLFVGSRAKHLRLDFEAALVSD